MARNPRAGQVWIDKWGFVNISAFVAFLQKKDFWDSNLEQDKKDLAQNLLAFQESYDTDTFSGHVLSAQSAVGICSSDDDEFILLDIIVEMDLENIGFGNHWKSSKLPLQVKNVPASCFHEFTEDVETTAVEPKRVPKLRELTKEEKDKIDLVLEWNVAYPDGKLKDDLLYYTLLESATRLTPEKFCQPVNENWHLKLFPHLEQGIVDDLLQTAEKRGWEKRYYTDTDPRREEDMELTRVHVGKVPLLHLKKMVTLYRDLYKDWIVHQAHVRTATELLNDMLQIVHQQNDRFVAKYDKNAPCYAADVGVLRLFQYCLVWLQESDDLKKYQETLPEKAEKGEVPVAFRLKDELIHFYNCIHMCMKQWQHTRFNKQDLPTAYYRRIAPLSEADFCKLLRGEKSKAHYTAGLPMKASVLLEEDTLGIAMPLLLLMQEHGSIACYLNAQATWLISYDGTCVDVTKTRCSVCNCLQRAAYEMWVKEWKDSFFPGGPAYCDCDKEQQGKEQPFTGLF